MRHRGRCWRLSGHARAFTDLHASGDLLFDATGAEGRFPLGLCNAAYRAAEAIWAIRLEFGNTPGAIPMSRPNPFQTFAHCLRFAVRRAAAEGDTFHVVTTGLPHAPRAVLSDRELFARGELAPENVEASADPFCRGLASMEGSSAGLRSAHRQVPR